MTLPTHVTDSTAPTANSPAQEWIPQRGQMRQAVRLFNSPRLPLSAEEVLALEQVAALDEVSQVVALPDLHMKRQLEAPSSLATASKEAVILSLSSPSPNCGMASLWTPYAQTDLSEAVLGQMFGALAGRLPLKPAQPVVSQAEILDILMQGAGWALDRYGLDGNTTAAMDLGGNALDPGTARQDILEAVPASLREIAGWKFAQVGKGNHFLELQVVEEILDAPTAAAWNLHPGQLSFMYHSDSGYLGAFVGRLYAHRRKNNWRGRLIEWKMKLPFHLQTGSAGRTLTRLDRHVFPRRFAALPAGTEEATRAVIALQAASNFAFANRLAIFHAIQQTLAQVFGEMAGNAQLIWDAPHNTIRKETIAGEDLWVHRHNAAKVVPPSEMEALSPYAQTGHPVLLPGTERTSSFLMASAEGARASLHSADHGAGRSAIKLGQPLADAAETLVYGYLGEAPERRAHLSDDGILEVVRVLQANQIARPVARLRPVAVLKG